MDKGFRERLVRLWAERLEARPDVVAELTELIPVREMAKPFVLSDKKRGVPPGMIQIKYGISRAQYYRIMKCSEPRRPVTLRGVTKTTPKVKITQ